LKKLLLNNKLLFTIVAGVLIKGELLVEVLIVSVVLDEAFDVVGAKELVVLVESELLVEVLVLEVVVNEALNVAVGVVVGAKELVVLVKTELLVKLLELVVAVLVVEL